ncbi:TBC1 domain family member 15-like [Saccoglossus kowalevskii]
MAAARRSKGSRIVFDKSGVFIHTAVGSSEDEDTLLGGRVKLIDHWTIETDVFCARLQFRTLNVTVISPISFLNEYFSMKLQWKSITEAQAQRNSIYRDRECLVDKDVSRTDRTHPCFEGQNNPNISMLYDILMTYCQYNFDLGYVQGMSDLLSPILVVIEDEVDAFWCFVGFMETDGVRNNFDMDQEGMKKQLINLNTLLHFLDPELYTYLDSKDSSNLYFCFRWLLIKFKREFSFSDIMRLWEVMWTGLPCRNYHLLICLAILDTEKPTLMKNDYGFNEILKVCKVLATEIY